MPMFNLSKIMSYSGKFFADACQNFFLILSETKESVFIKASQDRDYQEFEEWRSAYIKYLISVEKHILTNIAPRLLHDMLLLTQENIQKQIKSPFFYQEYLCILEQNLPQNTPVVFTHILRDTRARLRQKLSQQPKLALEYFRKDIVLQMIRLSGKKTTVRRFKSMLYYYKQLVPDEIYAPVKRYTKELLKNHTNTDVTQIDTNGKPYVEFQKKVDEVFSGYNTVSMKRAVKRKVSQSREQSKLTGLAILCLIASGSHMLLVKENKANDLQLFNLSNLNWSPILVNGMWQFFNQRLLQDVNFTDRSLFSAMLVLSSLKQSYAWMTGNNQQEEILKKSDEPITFFRGYNWTNGDASFVYSLVQTEDEGYAMAGPALIGDNSFTIKLSKWGEVEWAQTSIARDFSGWSIAQLLDQGLVVFGDSSTYSYNGNASIAISKFFINNGTQAWTHTLNSPYLTSYAKIKALPDGGFITLGYIYDQASKYSQSLLGKWDENGVLIWLKSLNVGVHNVGNYIQVIENNELIITGIVYFENRSDSDIFVAKCDAEGEVIWLRTFSTSMDDVANYIMQNTNQNFILIGRVSSQSLIMEVQETGNMTWANVITDKIDFSLSTVQEMVNGDYLVPASAHINNTYVPFLYQWYPDGTLYLAKKIDTGIEYSRFWIIVRTSDQGFVLAGHGMSDEGYIVLLLKLDSEAELINCPVLQVVSLPTWAAISFDSNSLNGSSPEWIFNTSSVTVRTLGTPLSEIIYCIDKDGGGGGTPLWQLIIEYASVPTGLIFFGSILGGIILCRRRRPKSEQFEYIREFDFKDLQMDDKPLGSGGYGEVFKGSIGVTYPEVAIKKLKPNTNNQNVVAKDGFMREVKLMRTLDHPNIVRLYGFSVNHLQENDEYYIIMEFVPNRSLAEAVFEEISETEYRRITSLTWQQRFDIAVGIARGLALLHPQIIHADLKSYNILLDKSCQPKICDFGLAKLLNQLGHNVLSSGKSIASGHYVAPELLINRISKPDAKTDMYSYGKILEDLVEAPFRNPGEDKSSQSNNKNMYIVTQADRTYHGKMTDLMQRCLREYDNRPTAVEAVALLKGGIERESHEKSPLLKDQMAVKIN